MSRNVLVTYASKYGATQEIAQRISAVLCQEGLQVDVVSIAGVKDIALYKAVVLGSAIYVGKWRREAVNFLQANAKTLAKKAIWLFSSGPTGYGDPVKLVNGIRLPATLQPLAKRIRPRDIAVFHGYINQDKITMLENWTIESVVKKPLGDFRDWDAITSWALSIATALKEPNVRHSVWHLSEDMHTLKS